MMKIRLSWVKVACWAAMFALMSGISVSRAGERIGNVTPERLIGADAESDQWLTGGRDYRQNYYSPLTDINKRNVRQLGFAWEYDIGPKAIFQSTPTVIDGVLFASGMGGAVYSLDARTGFERWRFEPRLGPIGCGGRMTNRGVAVWRGKVYVASVDGYLYALDADRGEVVWKVDTIVDRSRAYTSTGAPYVANGKIVIGNAGAECDARGYVTAYDSATGKQAWRFFIVPGDPKRGFEHPELEMAAKTWSPNSLWEVGLGGTAWDGMAYDPFLNLLYVGTGNGTPWVREIRSPGGGDNLFLSSILAINPDTGRLIWYYQTTPADNWDYTATQKLILADLKFKGLKRQVIMQAPKNGFFYVLDRRTGELLSADTYATVTWAKGVDLKTGRPLEVAQGDYSKEPKLIFPGPSGAHNWHPMAYNPKAGLVYIPVRDSPAVFAMPSAPFVFQKGQYNTWVALSSLDQGNGPNGADRQRGIASLKAGQPDPQPRFFIRGWDPARRKLVWQAETQSWNGVMTAAGGLVAFGRKDGQFMFLDSTTGRLLHTIDVGQNIASAPMSYKVGGEQYIAVMADDAKAIHDGFPVERSGQNGRILAFKLGGGAVPRVALEAGADRPTPPPIEKFGGTEQITLGRELFERHCLICHTEGGRAPDLTRMDAETHANFEGIVIEGQLAERGMVSFRTILSKDDAQAIHVYLTDLAWEKFQRHSSSSSASKEAQK